MHIIRRVYSPCKLLQWGRTRRGPRRWGRSYSREAGTTHGNTFENAGNREKDQVAHKNSRAVKKYNVSCWLILSNAFISLDNVKS